MFFNTPTGLDSMNGDPFMSAYHHDGNTIDLGDGQYNVSPSSPCNCPVGSSEPLFCDWDAYPSVAEEGVGYDGTPWANDWMNQYPQGHSQYNINNCPVHGRAAVPQLNSVPSPTGSNVAATAATPVPAPETTGPELQHLPDSSSGSSSRSDSPDSLAQPQLATQQLTPPHSPKKAKPRGRLCKSGDGVCELCHVQTTGKFKVGNLTRHMKTKHGLGVLGGPKPFLCPKEGCESRFSRPDNMRQHQRKQRHCLDANGDPTQYV